MPTTNAHRQELEVTLPAAFDLLWRSYFAVRGIRDMSHKDRWRWLDQYHDSFGSELTIALNLPRPTARAEAWLRLAEAASEPFGGLWPYGYLPAGRQSSGPLDLDPPVMPEPIGGTSVPSRLCL